MVPKIFTNWAFNWLVAPVPVLVAMGSLVFTFALGSLQMFPSEILEIILIFTILFIIFVTELNNVICVLLEMCWNPLFLRLNCGEIFQSTSSNFPSINVSNIPYLTQYQDESDSSLSHSRYPQHDQIHQHQSQLDMHKEAGLIDYDFFSCNGATTDAFDGIDESFLLISLPYQGSLEAPENIDVLYDTLKTNFTERLLNNFEDDDVQSVYRSTMQVVVPPSGRQALDSNENYVRLFLEDN